MRKIINLLGIALILAASSLYISSCTKEEVEPNQEVRMPTAADNDKAYLICEIDGRRFVAREREATFMGAPSSPKRAIRIIHLSLPQDSGYDYLGVTERYKWNGNQYDDVFSIFFRPLLRKHNIGDTLTIKLLGRPTNAETQQCFVAFASELNQDRNNAESIPFTSPGFTTATETGELKLKVIGYFRNFPIYNGTFWFDIKNPKTGKLIQVRNGVINFCPHYEFPSLHHNGNNFYSNISWF